MLTLADIPEWLEQLDAESRALAGKLKPKFASFARTVTLPAGSDALKALDGKIAYVIDGALRYTHNERLVRFYNEDDIFDQLLPDAVLRPEFSTSFLVCTPRELQHTLAVDPRFAYQWHRYRESQLNLMNGLCAVQSPAQKRIKPEIRMYSEGETIIEKGSPSKEIFVMISGTAAVLNEDTEIGEIQSNEIFGEIGFLIGSARATTVQAKDECLVQVVRGEEFKELMTAKPNIAVQLATTQARRIAGLNERILEQENAARC